MVAKDVREAALFEVLNAKKLSSQEIAASFVISPQFEQIIGPDHSFLIGPRGSGKTTLLRMLQGETLMFWQHRRAEGLRARIRYSSIFVPADQLWASQVGRGASAFGPRNQSRVILGVAAFTTQVLAALIETLQYRLDYFDSGNEPHLPARLSIAEEAELVRACSKAWTLEPTTLTLNSLLTALDLRLQHIATALEIPDAELARRLEDDDRFGRWLELSPIVALRFGVRAINRLTRMPNHRWALLLDEMELAPRAVHQAIMQNIRGGERNLVLKMSFSPFDNFVSEAFQRVGAATSENDFRPIYLWSGHRLGGRKLASGIFRSIWAELVGTPRSPNQVLGTSVIDASGHSWSAEDYSSDGDRMALIASMSVLDPSFKEYLDRRGIDITRPEDLSYNERSSTLRKVFPLLVFRAALLKFDDKGPRPRGRKKISEVFSGEDVVYACLEGNPRWMKAVFGQMIANADGAPSIREGTQYDALKDAADRFQSLLRLLPTGEGNPQARVLPIIDAISRYFNRRALGPFSADSPTTFVVDQDVPDSVHAALTVALNAGAIVHIRGNNSPTVLSNLIGERFRVTYLLAIRDGLEVPLRLGKAVQLSTILEGSLSSLTVPLFDRTGDIA